MTADGKLKAERAVNRVKERGRTNLSGGLLAALQTLYHIKEEKAALVESVLLFTDGKANVGIRDQLTITKATKYGINPHVSTCTHIYPTCVPHVPTFTPHVYHMYPHSPHIPPTHTHTYTHTEACWIRSTDRPVSSHLAMGVSTMLICCLA